jgi:hypothetical protein
VERDGAQRRHSSGPRAANRPWLRLLLLLLPACCRRRRRRLLLLLLLLLLLGGVREVGAGACQRQQAVLVDDLAAFLQRLCSRRVSTTHRHALDECAARASLGAWCA